MAGRLDLAYAALAEGEPEDIADDGAVRARVAGLYCFIDWMAGDLQVMRQRAARLLAVNETHILRESLGWTHYFLASIAYQRNDLPAAEAHARGAGGNPLLGQTDNLLAERVRLCVDLPGARPAGAGTAEA